MTKTATQRTLAYFDRIVRDGGVRLTVVFDAEHARALDAQRKPGESRAEAVRRLIYPVGKARS